MVVRPLVHLEGLVIWGITVVVVVVVVVVVAGISM